MAELLKGAPVVAVLNEKLFQETEALKAKNITPMLAIVRVGVRVDDIAYERGAIKRCEGIGVAVQQVTLPGDVSEEKLLCEIETLNRDPLVHGVLLFRPLPNHINDDRVRNALVPTKDVDGITDTSLAGVFTGNDVGFPPCTPQACMEILEHYGIDPKGKRAVVIGRSLVVGKPAAMMLLSKNATITICHTRTENMPSVCREGELLIVSAGRDGIVDKSYLSPDQVVLDVGINVSAGGFLCGDVNFTDAEAIVAAITPVPGGVGTVTTSVLVKHVVEAAKRQSEARI